MSLFVGKEAPHFEAPYMQGGEVHEKLSLKDLRGKNVVLFFYTLDFSPLCPTELLTFQEKLKDFTERNTAVIGCSVDSVWAHRASYNTPIQQGGIQGVQYPILSDITKEISKAYNVLTDDGVALRGTFLIDSNGILRHMYVNDIPLGRSIDETLRMVDALTFFEQNGQVCPANWSRGKKGIKPTMEGLKEYTTHKD